MNNNGNLPEARLPHLLFNHHSNLIVIQIFYNKKLFTELDDFGRFWDKSLFEECLFRSFVIQDVYSFRRKCRGH